MHNAQLAQRVPVSWPCYRASKANGMQVWLKPVAEMSFLYGNNVLKSGLGRMTEHTPAHTGVVVHSMSDVPLGFGVAAKSTADCRRADPSTVVVFHQSDVGEITSGSERHPASHVEPGAHKHVQVLPDEASLSAGEYLRSEDEL